MPSIRGKKPAKVWFHEYVGIGENKGSSQTSWLTFVKMLSYQDTNRCWRTGRYISLTNSRSDGLPRIPPWRWRINFSPFWTNSRDKEKVRARSKSKKERYTPKYTQMQNGIVTTSFVFELNFPPIAPFPLVWGLPEKRPWSFRAIDRDGRNLLVHIKFRTLLLSMFKLVPREIQELSWVFVTKQCRS